MRILGEIPHESLKITVFEMNSKVSIQFEDGLETQTYKFREGSLVTNLKTAFEFCDKVFIESVLSEMNTMQKNKTAALDRKLSNLNDQFPSFI